MRGAECVGVGVGLHSKLLSVRGACAEAIAVSTDFVDFVVVVDATEGGGGDSVSECASLICEIDEAIDEMEFVRFGAVTMIVEVPLCIGLGRGAELRRRFYRAENICLGSYSISKAFRQ